MATIKTVPHPDFERVVRDSFGKQGLMTLLGARLVEVVAGRVVIEVVHTPSLTQQAGSFHGGVLGALADSAGGYAALSLMPAGAEVVTIEYKINFMRPAVGPLLQATGEIVRAGKSITVAKMECRSGPADALVPCAVVQATFMRV
jgi:uncharacterized protein (TIGR00369 family)